MPINIKTSKDKPALAVPYHGDMTVQAVLDKYREELGLTNDVCLFFQEGQLHNKSTLAELGVNNGDTVTTFPTPPPVPPVPGTGHLSSFKPKPLAFLTLEPNGEDFTMVGRDHQAEKLSNTFLSFHEAPKMKVAVISTSRGMGKTFFLKKMCLSDRQPFARARNCGRIIVLECQKGLELLRDGRFEKFWSRLIIYHLSHLFNSYWCETAQGNIQFRRLDLAEVVDLTNTNGEGSFAKWVYSVADSLTSTVEELIQLTNIAYKTTDTSVPVFALDNGHNFSKVLSNLPSTTQGKHNYLSRILTHLTDVWCPCIVAGTTDEDIHLLGDYSNFVVEHVFLTRIERKHWNLMGEESIKKHNKMTEGANVKWLTLDVAEYGDELSAAMNDATLAEDLGTSPPAHHPQGNSNMEMTNDDCEVQHHDEDDNTALLGMIYHSAQVPRLMRLAFHNWHKGKRLGYNLTTITENFEAEAKLYYRDACNLIKQYTVGDFALLLLACSVHHKPMGDFLLPGKFNVKDLMDKSIIFPYAVERVLDNSQFVHTDTSYVIPSVLFLCLDNAESDIRSSWNDVKDELGRLVPGLKWQHLFPSFTRWWRKSLTAYDAGRAWEDLLVASLAVRYCLHKQCYGQEDWCRFSDIYSLASHAQASKVVLGVSVNFCQGIVHPQSEATIHTKLSKAIAVNNQCYHARYDFALPTQSSGNMMCQAKSSLGNPTATALNPQIMEARILLWFYPGRDEDSPLPPAGYRSSLVSDKIKKRELAFLSGAGCVSHLALDFIILMKNLAAAVHKLRQDD